MAWTQTDVERLERLIASGTRVTKFTSGDTSREQTLQSLDDMLALLTRMKADVAGANAPPRFAVTEFIRD